MAVRNHPVLTRNAPGRWYTTGGCMACGAPEAEPPTLFPAAESEELKTFFVRQQSTSSEVKAACCAAQVCCVKAVRYGGRDRGIFGGWAILPTTLITP
jgi:hypothetical protein